MVAGNIVNNTYTSYLRVTNDNALSLTAPLVGRYKLYKINFIKFDLSVKILKNNRPPKILTCVSAVTGLSHFFVDCE